MDNLKQHRTLRNIIWALLSISKNEFQKNEATLKHNFFYYLRKYNTEHLIAVEENLKEYIKFNERVDFYLSDNTTKSFKNDVVIEFKINCFNNNLIKHDLKKLESIRKLHPLIATVFINCYTAPLDFKKIKKAFPIFSKTKVYSIFIAPSINNYHFESKGEIRIYPLNRTTIITSAARFLEQGLIPLKTPTIRIPNLNGMMKSIGLCLEPKPKKDIWGGLKYIKYYDLK